MQTREVPQQEWKEFLEDFSRTHTGELVDTESLSVELGVQRAARRLPLLGVRCVTTGPGFRPCIEIMLGDTPRACLSHAICNPSHVRVAQWKDSYSAALQIEADDGWSTLLRVGPEARILAPGMVMDDIAGPMPPEGDPHAHRLNRAQWGSSFEQIIRHYRGTPITIHQSSSRSGLESVVNGMPLLNITVDDTREGEDPTVRVKAGDPHNGTVTELVAAPSSVLVTETGGTETALSIESSTGERVLVEFHPGAQVA